MKTFALGVSLVLLAAGAAGAQEREGAGRFEINAMPAGAMFFTASGDEAQPEFGNYVVGGMFTINLNRHFGVETEAGNLVGVRQNVNFNNLRVADQHTPCMLAYTGSLIMNPWGSDRRFVPFVIGGVGGLTLLDTDEVADLGITSKSSLLTGNVGAGLKWYSARTWGLRGEYRLTVVDGKASAPAFFGRETVRYGHRVSVGLLLTY